MSRSDSTSDIKRAFRDISRKIHPDKVPESQKKKAEEEFRFMSVSFHLGILCFAHFCFVAEKGVVLNLVGWYHRKRTMACRRTGKERFTKGMALKVIS